MVVRQESFQNIKKEHFLCIKIYSINHSVIWMWKKFEVEYKLSSVNDL